MLLTVYGQIIVGPQSLAEVVLQSWPLLAKNLGPSCQ